MNYNQIKLSIYESYSNNEITFEAANALIDRVDNAWADSIVSEMADAENEFINASLSIVTESTGIDVLTEAAKTFGDKAKALWNKFKAWVKTIIDKILGRKKHAAEVKVVADPKLSGAMDNMSKATSKLKSARTSVEIAAALAAIAAATVGINKYNKLKVQNAELKGANDDYAKICDKNAKLIQDLQDAADKASYYIQKLEKESDEKDASIRDLENKIRVLETSLDTEMKKIRNLGSEVVSTQNKLDASNRQNQQMSEKIESLKKEIADTKKKLSDEKAAAKKRESNLTSERDSANAKIKQMTPSYLMGIATQATRAIEKTTAIALPQKSTKTIDDEAKAKQIADAKKKQEAEDLEKYKQAAMKKYEAAKAEQKAKMNEEAKKKIPDIKAELKRATDRLDGFNIRRGRSGYPDQLSLTYFWPDEIAKAEKDGDFWVAYRYCKRYLEHINKEIEEAEKEVERIEHPERFGRRRRMW